MGWPNEDGSYPNSLDLLRRTFREYGISHKWHRTDDEIDNDFFFVLGTIDRDMLMLEKNNVEIAAVVEQWLRTLH